MKSSFLQVIQHYLPLFHPSTPFLPDLLHFDRPSLLIASLQNHPDLLRSSSINPLQWSIDHQCWRNVAYLAHFPYLHTFPQDSEFFRSLSQALTTCSNSEYDGVKNRSICTLIFSLFQSNPQGSILTDWYNHLDTLSQTLDNSQALHQIKLAQSYCFAASKKSHSL